MNVKKITFPLWMHFVIDLLCIALFTTSFYYFNYRMPRELNGDFTVIPKTTPIYSDSNTSKTESDNNSRNNVNESDWSVKFADKFTDTIKTSDLSYSSPNVSITINQNTINEGTNSQITYYVADIYIADIDCLQSGFAHDKYGVGYSEDLSEMGKRLNTILAINGDYYGNGQSGVVVRNSTIYRTSADSSDVCVLYYDGTMKTFSPDEFDINQAKTNGAYQTWSFGPTLLDNNENSMTDFNSHVTPKNPRTAIGYYEPGHYCFVLVDGRDNNYSIGMTMTELSELMQKLGCKTAYNLDGGQSSEMTFSNNTISKPYKGGRNVSDCIFIKELG